MLLDPFPIVSG